VKLCERIRRKYKVILITRDYLAQTFCCPIPLANIKMQIKKFSILLKKIINIVGKIFRIISRFFVTLNNDYQFIKK